MQDIPMYIRALAIASLLLLVIIASTSAEDIKIMGLTETNAARTDSTRPLTYLTGSCQTKHRRMKCHLSEITVAKVDTTPLADKAKAVLEQVTQDPHNVEQVIARQMPYLCQEPTNGQDRREATAPSAPLSPGEQALQQAIRDFCAEKSAAHLRALLDRWGTLQAQTCALWVTSYDKAFTLRGTEWVSTQGPTGPCGVIETAVFSHPVSNSHGHDIRFNRYRIHHRVTKNNAPHCTAGKAKDYVFLLEKPRYTECVYIDFSPWTFGWSWWQPRSP
jgi:hypothetical protein